MHWHVTGTVGLFRSQYALPISKSSDLILISFSSCGIGGISRSFSLSSRAPDLDLELLLQLPNDTCTGGSPDRAFHLLLHLFVPEPGIGVGSTTLSLTVSILTLSCTVDELVGMPGPNCERLLVEPRPSAERGSSSSGEEA
jgi:hypothetical protein